MTTFGLPALNIPTAIGLSVVISFLTQQVDLKENDARSPIRRVGEGMLLVVVRPTMALLVGWVALQFV